MKSEVHPDYHPVVFKDGEHEIVTRSTATSEQTREIDGVEHYVINVDISAYTHPFYTGQKKLVDTEGRVDRFKKRYNLEDDDEATESSEEEQQEEASAADEESSAEEASEQEDDAEADQESVQEDARDAGDESANEDDEDDA